MMATTIKIPTHTPALNIPPITSQELSINMSVNNINAIDFFIKPVLVFKITCLITLYRQQALSVHLYKINCMPALYSRML